MLDTSLTESTVSTDTEDDVGTDSEFDLSDPEALAVKEDSIFLGSLDVAIENEIQDTNEFVSEPTVLDTPIFTSAADTSASNEDRQTGGGDNEDHIHISETSFVRGPSGQAHDQVGRSRTGTRAGRAQRRRSGSVQSEIYRRGRSCERASHRTRSRGRGRSCERTSHRTRSRGRSRGRRSCSARGRWQGSKEQRDFEKPEREPLKIESIRTKTDSVTTFPFTPIIAPGYYLPDNTDTSDPESLFKLFFSDDIVAYICKASDEHADLLQDRRKVMYKYYKGMSPEDFYKMVALLIHFGYKKIPHYRVAWSKTSLCYDPFVSCTLSRNRFESLMYFLHVVTQEDEERFKNDNDKLAKVRPLSDHINRKSSMYCQPEKEISVDERMVRSKARFSFKQYICNKPTKWGFKLWCLCNSSNGYTIKFSVYRGKSGEVSSKKGLSYDVVMHLIKDYLNQGRTLYVDNFYTSPTLALDLFEFKTHLTGTLDKTRSGVPVEVLTMLEMLSDKETSRGDGYYVRDKSVVYCAWKDTKCILLLSTQHPGHSENTVKRNSKDSTGKFMKKDVPIPSPVYFYNKEMGGVDKSDQLIHYYNVLRQTKKYWKTLFFHFIDIACVNAYIIHKELERNPMSHYKFREKLTISLSKTEYAPSSSNTLDVDSTEDDSDFLLTEHQNVLMDKRLQCAYCKLESNEVHYTTRQCVECKAPLCFRDRNCFIKWHDSTFTASRKTWKTQQLLLQPKVGRPLGSTVTKGRGKRKRKGW